MSTPTFLLIPDRVFDGGTARAVDGHGVVISGDRILDVGPAADLHSPSTQTIRLTGTLLPGLIDCHTHLCLAATADPAATLKAEPRTRTTLRAARHLLQHLSAGVTTIRDLGGVDRIDLDLARAQESGAVMGPRVVAAGSLVAMTGGHACYLGVEADGVDACTRAARAQLKAGARVLKVVATGGVISAGVEPGSPQLSEAEMAAVVREGAHAGVRVAAHAQGTVGIMNALRAGVHTIEHGFWLDDAAVALMRERHATLVATFAAAHAMMDHLDALPDFIRRKMEAVGDAHARSFKLALHAGVNLAAGTDAGTPFNPHGSLCTEVALHVRHGASPERALHAATGGAATALGREDIGWVRRGALADLVLVDGDPLVDIGALERVTGCWQSGRRVDLDGVRSALKVLPN